MSPFEQALEGLTRVPGVQSALIVSAEDGLVVGEASMGGVVDAAVAALSASLFARIGEMTAAAGRQPPAVAHLEACRGGLMIVPAAEGLAARGRGRARSQRRPAAPRAAGRGGATRLMRAVEPWVEAPLAEFLRESSARLVLVMTSSGRVVAQHGFSRTVDVMRAAALGAGIMASTAELARTMGLASLGPVAHQGREQACSEELNIET